jgi:hypothetical protein
MQIKAVADNRIKRVKLPVPNTAIYLKLLARRSMKMCSLDCTISAIAMLICLRHRMLDPRHFRLRYFLMLASAAVLVAAVLRHILHVYGGISPKDIGADALLAAAAVGIAIFCLRNRFRR